MIGYIKSFNKISIEHFLISSATQGMKTLLVFIYHFAEKKTIANRFSLIAEIIALMKTEWILNWAPTIEFSILFNNLIMTVVNNMSNWKSIAVGIDSFHREKNCDIESNLISPIPRFFFWVKIPFEIPHTFSDEIFKLNKIKEKFNFRFPVAVADIISSSIIFQIQHFRVTIVVSYSTYEYGNSFDFVMCVKLENKNTLSFPFEYIEFTAIWLFKTDFFFLFSIYNEQTANNTYLWMVMQKI